MTRAALWEAYLSNWTLQPGSTGLIIAGFMLAALLLTKISWKLGAIIAALFSHWYVEAILHGAPRIIDAGTYWFQSKHLFGLTAGFPSALYHGRFLLEGPDGQLHGIFPPGYPSLLAVFQLLQVPMLLGPALAALLVWRTHALTRLLGRHQGIEQIEQAAALAAALCAANLCLRYHTADTMSHGFTALLLLIAVHALLTSRALWAGAALGAIACTRIGSLPAILLLAAAFSQRRTGSRGLCLLALGTAPGLLWLGYHQWIATGSALGSTQLAYYKLSDGPEGCFGWGLGPTRGCSFEHGDYAHDILPHGLTLKSALHVTARRVAAHCKDFLGFELLSLAGFAAMARLRGEAGRIALLIPAHIAAYAMFYFDGNYPGGGARFFAELLPLEFSLLTVALAGCARAVYVRPLQLGYLIASVFHGTPSLFALRDRFGPSPVLAGAAPMVQNDLQFLVNEHAIRERQGDLQLMHDALPGSALAPRRWQFEADDFWPMLAQLHGHAVPRWEANSCASGGRVLALQPEHAQRGSVRLRVPFARGRRAEVFISTLGTPGAPAVRVRLHEHTQLLAQAPSRCLPTSLGVHTWEFDEDDFNVEFDGPAAIDSIVLVDKTP